MTHLTIVDDGTAEERDSCIFIGRACLKESSESVGRKGESGRESERCKVEEK